MNSFFGSPVWATILGVVGTGLITLIKMMAGMHSKLNALSTAVTRIARDVTDIKKDKNIMRYSDPGNSRARKGRHDV